MVHSREAQSVALPLSSYLMVVTAYNPGSLDIPTLSCTVHQDMQFTCKSNVVFFFFFLICLNRDLVLFKFS